ncbi:uncharacterized protein Z518_04550 [Rhinocladiella mackenziei CBS 650.93]|uniref:Uncharacterized protein n=1 Tax=Rhinocladiella mackenziei CBS 650.93 TaxID=1442369 RepID=A0A0D2ILH6_9EURO|nr:uncharacterized protein Z518_04550 [Rhinocladiella mackenziei CBS 650.93]KIX06574.1 hypothetical protein Z518_04550 [Rhinocladiella mackenziei CBS 650.93]
MERTTPKSTERWLQDRAITLKWESFQWLRNIFGKGLQPPDDVYALVTSMVIKLGLDFNFGQLAQAENAPASLAGLRQMRGRDRAFEMRFMEQVLDLSGA